LLFFGTKPTHFVKFPDFRKWNFASRKFFCELNKSVNVPNEKAAIRILGVVLFPHIASRIAES